MTDFGSSNAASREPKGPPQACLFVANLPGPEVAEERVREHFTQFGEVLKVKFIKDRSAKPYAFVQFNDVDSANAALRSSKLFDGKRLRVERAKVNRTLFIAKLSRNLSNAQLRERAEAFGPVESVTIIKNHQTNKSKGCGFVKYVYREDSMDAFVGLKNANRKWIVEWATSTNDPDTLGVDKYNIFIGGLNIAEVTKELLEEKFKEYGDIESVTLINKDDSLEEPAGPSSSLSRSAFAFIRYADPVSSAAAIEAENGQEWLGRRIRVQYCESAEMKTKRRASKYNPNPTPPPLPQHHPAPAPPPSAIPFISNPPSSAQQYFQQPRGVPSSPIVSAPVLVMGGLPMYTPPPSSSSSSSSSQKYSYSRKDNPPPIIYPAGISTYPLNPALVAYAQQPWIFAQQPPLQSQGSSSSQQQQSHQGGGPYQGSSSSSSSLHQLRHRQQHRSSGRDGVPSPSSDDSLGNDGDGGLTQSMAAWVLK